MSRMADKSNDRGPPNTNTYCTEVKLTVLFKQTSESTT